VNIYRKYVQKETFFQVFPHQSCVIVAFELTLQYKCENKKMKHTDEFFKSWEVFDASSEIEFLKTFVYKNIEVTFNDDAIVVELVIDGNGLKLESITCHQDIINLIQLLYGEV